MRIAIKEPGPTGPASARYYFAEVSQRWAIAHDNGALFSCGLTVGEDLTRASLNALRARGSLTEISHETWNHSGCQSACVLRGAKECRW